MRLLGGLRVIAMVAAIVTSTSAQEVRVGVLGLFHPSQLTVSSSAGTVVIVHFGEKEFPLDSSSSTSRVTLHAKGSEFVLAYGTEHLVVRKVAFTSREGAAADFVLDIPGKIVRRYRGQLEIISHSGELVAVVTMDLETAVASVVAAETVPGEPIEALKAQAVAVRSYFAAGKGRHENFDFCDTTHCQFLRSPPPPQSAAFKAAEATRGLVLEFESQVFAAMYTRSCSGRTHTPSEVGLIPGIYPYYSAECAYCRRHPARWQSRIPAKDAIGLIPSDEPSRLRIARQVGWSTVPSNDFKITRVGGLLMIHGVGQGHGIGLCQTGSRAMATNGANFREILAHYYPNAVLVNPRPEGATR